MRLHVTIHDVSPAFDAHVDLLLAMCHAHGIKPGLLVVPNYHGHAPLASAPHHQARLRTLQASGHEIFLHGFTHRCEPKPMSARRYFRQRVVSAGEAEFADVDQATGEQRLDDGLAVLEKVGLIPSGFIAPAWSFKPWLIPALARRGLQYTEDHLRIYRPVAGQSAPSVVMNYASRSIGRVTSTTLYCRAARHAAHLLPGRIALHPMDVSVALLRNEIEGLLRFAEGHTVEHARDLFAN